MNSILRNVLRLMQIGIYPFILFFSFYILYQNKDYKFVIKNNYKKIILNTSLFALIGALAIFVFFYFEDTIYTYDYAGHWQRSLELRQLFFENPSLIFSKVYESMNHSDYSHLPALFGLGLTIWNTSYGYFCLCIFIYFLLPTTVLLQIIYFKYCNKYNYLPLFVFVCFYPLYLTIFYGEIDVVGIFFLLMIDMLVLIPNFKDLTYKDNILVNLYAFIAIFLRRWYLYPLVFTYIALFVKYLINYKANLFSKESFADLLKIISSGILMLFVILIFFMPFFKRVVFNNFSEAYSYYDRPGKLISFINFYSPIILLISLLGFYQLIKVKKYKESFIFIILLFCPTLMFWSIQSFEYHHYFISTIPIIFLFVIGLLYILNQYNKLIGMICLLLLIIQSIGIFTIPQPIKTFPLISNIRKQPIRLEYKEEVIDMALLLKSLLVNDWQSAYIASGNSTFNDSIIRNSILPDLDMPYIDSAVLDLRDGFPKDIEYIQYIITIDPILYSDQNYQHIYDILSNAIWHEPLISKAYKEIYQTEIDGLKVQLYEKVEDYTPEMKQYFYDQMISFYPDKTDFFAYILE